jgi:transposase IS4-like protein/DDE family transposase
MPSRASVDEGAFERMRASIDPKWIEQALCATGTATLRKRRLPAEQVIWLVLGMALYRNRRIDELVERLDLVLPSSGRELMARSAVSQARQRVGDEPLKWLFERCAREWAHASARSHAWRDLAIYGVDGTTVRVPDSEANGEFFGYPTGSRGPGSYPLASLVTLMAVRSHLLAAAAIGPYGDERPLAQNLWSELPDESLVIVDRNFFASTILVPISEAGKNRYWLTRAKRTSSWKVLATLGAGDELIEMETSHEAKQKNPSLGRTWQARAIRYQRPGFQPQTLITSLEDPQRFPAKEIIAMYHERWELELGYDEVKTDLLERNEAIRSKTPKGVLQELWAIGLAYNLIRLEMERIAKEARVAPRRISFVLSLHLIRDEWMWAAASSSPGAIPGNLRRLREKIVRFLLPPRKIDRSYPRAVKIKMSSYPRKPPRSARVAK